MELKRSSSSNNSFSTIRRGDIALQACGRSVRQLEETINRLTCENFNLKLRNYKLEEDQRRSNSELYRRSSSKIKLEEELRQTRRELQIVNVDNDALRKQYSKLYATEMVNKRLKETLSEKDAVLKEAAIIISTYQEETFKTEMLVDGIRKLLKAYDEFQ